MNPIPVVPATQDYAQDAAARTRPHAFACASGSCQGESPDGPAIDPDDPRVLEALEEYLTAIEEGRPVDRLEFLGRHPTIAVALKKATEGLEFINVVGGQLVDPDRPDEAAAFESEPGGGKPLGDFRILRQIGRGGMGVVYEAEQLSLGRRVALKVLPFAAALDAKQLQRFKNEAQAAAQLHHQHIVPVYGVGSERGVHYYAMQFIDGQTLATMIADLRKQKHPQASAARAADASAKTRAEGEAGTAPPDGDTVAVAALSTERPATSPAFFRTVASLGVQAAEALEHAHQLGVIHRDIKPANLLIDSRGQLWITDFGLAQFQSDNRLTLTGDILGTLRYMSPEAALAKRVTVDQRTDIYSLGVTLYELLTLEPLFESEDRQELLRQIAFEEPQAPRRRNKSIPAELETIVLKAIEKNPADRYATAQELADDLGRFLKDEPIRAKRPTLLQRGRKWARRHRPIVVSAMVATAVVVAVAIGALLISVANISAALQAKSDALGEKTDALAEKTAALEREKDTSYLQRTALAGRELAAGNVGRAEELLDDCPPERRGWEWHFLKRQRYDGEPSPLKHSATVTRVAFSPDGRQIASACYDGSFQVWDVQTRERHPLEPQLAGGRPVLVRGMIYSPDGRYLALARHDGTVCVWDAARRQPLYNLEGHKGPAWDVAFSPDSRTLASAGADKSVRLWDMTSGTALRVFSEHPAAVKGVAFRADGRSVLAACVDGTVKIWDRDTGRPTFSFHAEVQYPFYAWFSPDARRLAWSCMDGVMKVWDTTTGQLEITKQTNTWQLRAVAFHKDGKRMALAGFDGTVRLLDASSGREMLTIFAHPSVASHVVFSHDGNKIASAGYDHTLRIWDATPLPDGGPSMAHCITLQTGHKDAVCAVAFSPDGRWLASSSWDSTAKVWECSRHAPRDEGHPLAERDGYVLRYSLRGHRERVMGVVFSSDNRTLASGSWDKTVKLWDLQTPVGDSLSERRTISCTERVVAIALSPDGRLLGIGQSNGIGVYDPSSGEEVAPFKKTPAPVPTLAFTADSRCLVSAGASDPAIKFWHVDAKEMTFEIRHHSNATVAVSPDGRLIAAPSRLAVAGPAVNIWEVLDWDAKTSKTPYQERHTLSGHAGRVGKVTFSPDGRYLASGSWDSTIKVWDLKAIAKNPKAEPVTLRGHAGAICGLAFSPDGRRLASGGGYAGHGEVKVWDASLWQKNANEEK